MDTNDVEMTEEEKRGVEAIIFLQSLAGIAEPTERALRNWRNFREWEKTNTIAAYNALK